MIRRWQDVLVTDKTPQTRLWHSAFVLCSAIEKFNRTLGLTIAWLALIMAITTFVIVVMRYGFHTGSIRMQESALYMHGLLFMLAAAYCMQQNQHVRIDIFYSGWSMQRRALIDLGGTFLFLLPVTAFSFLIAWEYVASSWGYLEKSREPGGLPLVFALKAALLVMPFILFIQGLADAWRNYCFLRGWLAYKEEGEEGGQLL